MPKPASLDLSHVKEMILVGVTLSEAKRLRECRLNIDM